MRHSWWLGFCGLFGHSDLMSHKKNLVLFELGTVPVLSLLRVFFGLHLKSAAEGDSNFNKTDACNHRLRATITEVKTL